MVITLYADRRSPDIADIAGRLAQALEVRVRPREVVVATPRALAPAVRTGVAHAPLNDPSSPGTIGGTLRALSQRYAVTLVAVAGAPDEQVLAACDSSDLVLVVSEPSVASLRATQRTLKLCSSLGYGLDKVAVVLHGVADDAPLAPADAALALKRDIFWVIPGEGSDDAERTGAFDGLAERLTTSRM